MLGKEKIDVVHVCTPSGDHKGPAIAAMETGEICGGGKAAGDCAGSHRRDDRGAKKHGVKLAGMFQNRWNEANRASGMRYRKGVLAGFRGRDLSRLGIARTNIMKRADGAGRGNSTAAAR